MLAVVLIMCISCSRDAPQSTVTKFIALYNCVENDRTGIDVLDVSKYGVENWITDIKRARKVNGPIIDHEVSMVEMNNGNLEYEILVNDGTKFMRLTEGHNGLIVGFGIGNSP